MREEFSWKFPKESFILNSLERYVLVALCLVVFLFSWHETYSLFYAFIFTFIFLGMHLVFSYIIQIIRNVEEKYHLTKTHLHIVRKTRYSHKEEKIALKDIKHHKLDKRFLGGYLLTTKRKHLLFFNTKDEVEKVGKVLLKKR